MSLFHVSLIIRDFRVFAEDAYEGPLHKKYRHIAYLQYVKWIHGYVGKQIRVVLPSCAVSCIRTHFPSPGDEEHFNFVGFKYPDL